MPNYDYKCEKCEETFEIFQSMKDERLTDCPDNDCDGKVKRLIGTGAGIIFKGSGFYSTDNRSESYKKDSKNDSKSGGGDKKASKEKSTATSSAKTSSGCGGGCACH